MPAENFWTRLENNLGAFTITSLEKAAGLGASTLLNARKRGTVLTLDTVLAVTRVLGVTPAALLGPDTPAELLGGAAPDPTLQRIPLRNLTASPLNPRRTIAEEPLAELAESIVTQGLLQNLVVRRDADQQAIYWVVAGERRFRALSLLAAAGRLPADLQAGIPCRVIEVSDADHQLAALAENLQRQDVHPMEEAEAIARLHRSDPKKFSTRYIAERLGVTQRHIQLRLQLAEKLTAEGKEKLRAGEITLAQAKLIASRPEAEQGELLQDALWGADERDLATAASQNMMPAEHAVFDLAASKLETWESPAGELFICDFQAAMALQVKVVKAKKAELLKAGRPWVDELPYAQPHRYTEGGKGAVIVLNPHTGQVEIAVGLDRAAEKAAPTNNDWKRLRDAEQRYSAEHCKATAALLTEIRQQLTHQEARALMLFDALVPFQNRVLCGTRIFEDKGLTNLAQGSGLKDCKQGDEERLTQAFEHLLEIKGGRAENLFTALIGECIAVPAEGALSPALKHLVKVMRIDLPQGDILLDTPKLRTARIKSYMETVPGQTDLEDAVAQAAA